MKTKLIQTKDYLLLIDEEAEIKGTPCLCYNSIKNTWGDDVILYQGSMPEYHYKGFQKIVAYYPLTKEAKELDLPLLPNPFEDLEYISFRKAKEIFENSEGRKPNLLNDIDTLVVSAIQEGYKAAQSKQFSLEDMNNLALFITNNFKINAWSNERYGDENNTNIPSSKIVEEFIKSLSTQQLPKEFIPEYINTNSFGSETNGYDSGNFVLKTITNSEGKEELVGTYKY